VAWALQFAARLAAGAVLSLVDISDEAQIEQMARMVLNPRATIRSSG